MRSVLRAVVLAMLVCLAMPTRVVAQSPAPATPVSTPAVTPVGTPVTTPASVVPGAEEVGDVEEDDGDDRPWGRLLIFIPLSVLFGAAAVVGRRTARDRGWIRS